MKRTSPWIFVAGVAVQLAALGLCAWAMERWLGTDALAEAAAAAAPASPPASGAPPAPTAPYVATAPYGATVAHAGTAPHAATPPFGTPAPAGAPLFDVAAEATASAPVFAAGATTSPTQPPRAADEQPRPSPAAAPVPPGPHDAHAPSAHLAPDVVRPAARPAPLFGPPPAHAARPAPAVPPFVFEGGEDGTQVLRGQVGERSLVIGIGSDGNIRCVDVDGGRYSGQSESARARLREVDGSRAFTVQLGIDASGALHASFTGGGHDGETIALSPHVEGSAS